MSHMYNPPYLTEFNGDLFEGDIKLPPNLSRAGRKTNRWPSGVFYYHLTTGISMFYCTENSTIPSVENRKIDLANNFEAKLRNIFLY